MGSRGRAGGYWDLGDGIIWVGGGVEGFVEGEFGGVEVGWKGVV